MSKGSWRRMDLRGWRCKNVYDDAMIFNDDLNIPVKAGHHGRRGGDHQPWRQEEPATLEQLHGAL